MLSFVWDEEKAAINLEKHDVSFAEAKSVFYDDHARLIADEDNSENEERFLLLGMSFTPRLLLVCHCYKEDDRIVRIISARKSTRHEAHMYRRLKP
ncbi:MAG: BrnT family toxin [Desulfuromonadales bacterium]